MPAVTDCGDSSSWAAACLLAGLFFYLIPTGPQQNIASGIRLTLLRPFVDIRSALSAARSRSREADMLRAQVDSLRAWVANNAPAIEENRRLRILIGLAPMVERSYRAVSVHRPGNLGSQSTIVLDRGYEQGVHGSSPIITADGLAGRVLEAHPSLSIGMDWSHPDFRASVMSEDGELYGVVGPEPATFGGAERLILTGIPYFEVLADGTLVVTSGRGGVYPRGVPVGRVGGIGRGRRRMAPELLGVPDGASGLSHARAGRCVGCGRSGGRDGPVQLVPASSVTDPGLRWRGRARWRA